MTIVLPVYNAGSAVTVALQAIDSLTYPATEVVIINDASTDDTLKYVTAFVDARDSWKVLDLQRNAGPAVARNIGLTHASGEFVWFADWDDQWSREIVSVLVDAARDGRADMSMVAGTWRLPSGRDVGLTDGSSRKLVVTGFDAVDLLLRGVIRGYLWNKLFRRDVLGVDPFPDIRMQEDLSAVASVLPRCRTVVLLPDRLYHHVKRPGSVSSSSGGGLDHLEVALLHVEAAVESLPSEKRSRCSLDHYRVAFYQLGRVGTALRLGGPEIASDVIREFKAEVTLVKIARASIISPKTGMRALLVKAFGRAYPATRSLLIAVRNQIKKSV
ncbi:glycosyltransferase family 2 protein [Nesterenkonia sp. E16_7]|uniref:glycosyltransferase n=1 Tax=unclassified Nesterenkonia TaxID=2629769 RepID=UPI001A923A25|nr:glycosyltransferase family 2 protein [Nesterenkonia sp. E16_10]MBO0599772.1 glycosyltransferase family 2 protein [Nesterenkonia sp. E16_7]